MEIDEELISGCKKFRREAQEALYKLAAPMLKAICMRYSNDIYEAEDSLHEGFMKIFVKIDQYKGNGSFEGWMKKIILNSAINNYNKKRLKLINHDQITDDYPETESEEENDISISNNLKYTIQNTEFTNDEMNEAINALPQGYRVVFKLFAIEGLKHGEIANILKIKESTSKSQLVRARKLLQKKLYELAISKINQENQNNG